MTKLNAFFAAAIVAGAAIAAPANAAPTISFTPGSSVGAGYNVVQNFNGASGSYGVTGVQGSDYGIITGNVSGIGAVPNGSGTPYLAVFGGKSVTYTFANAVSNVAFDWGTASSDNVLTITDINGLATTYSVPNSSVPNGTNYNANGLLVSAANGPAIRSLTFASGSNSFEVDNIAVAVPEPATWGMMILGFGLMGVALRRRSTNVAFA